MRESDESLRVQFRTPNPELFAYWAAQAKRLHQIIKYNNPMWIRLLIASCVLLLSTGNTPAAKNDWAEGTSGEPNGATRDFYNRAGLLPWKHFMGDWRDAKDVAQGNESYAVTHVIDDDTPKSIEWDVTALATEWMDGKHQNQGFFLRVLGDRGNIRFASRESNDTQQRPRLILVGRAGAVELTPEADTHLAKSTFRSMGEKAELIVSDASPTLLRFDLSGATKLGEISKATLILFTTKQFGATDIGVFRCQQGHDSPHSVPILGIATKYWYDNGIAKDDDVVFAADFESQTWSEQWTTAGEMDAIGTVSSDAAREFIPLNRKALRVRIAKGKTGALNTIYKFQRQTGDEPEEIYFRYYLRLGSDWNQTVQGGKMPGISGTYGAAGWGGRKVDGTDGWSARGSFFRSIPNKNPLGGLHPIGTYCYHADMKGQYGDSWVWNRGYRGYLQNNRWYCIEQFLKLNTPGSSGGLGQNDGVLRAWVDGRLAFEKTDIRFRHVDRLKIEQVWMNVYHGGTIPSPYDQHLFIDNVVIARQYIGPMSN